MSFIRLGAYFMEDEIADSSVERPVRKFESGSVVFAECESVRYMLQTGVPLTLLLCVTPLRIPVIHSCDLRVRKTAGAANRQSSYAAADIE